MFSFINSQIYMGLTMRWWNLCHLEAQVSKATVRQAKTPSKNLIAVRYIICSAQSENA